jgi:alanyl-tRNA synthetase
VLRKIMRRAMRHGKRLGATAPFLHRLVDVLVAQMGEAYPELRDGRDTIVRVIRAEEDRFDVVLSAGLPKLEELLEAAAAAGNTVPGDEAFKLYDTFGLPLDFIEDLAGERKLTLDRQAFDRAMEAQRGKARARSAFDRKGDDFAFGAPTTQEGLRAVGDRFEGYTTTDLADARIVALFDDQKRQVAELLMGATGYVALDRTPFYVEAGGQVSDIGTLQSDAGVVLARVDGVVRLGPGLPRGHHVQVTGGPLSEGLHVQAIVDAPTRDATRRNHTATHLLHAALRQVLGTHVKQAGSLVAPDRLRFDFTHFAALTPEEIESIERIVNEQIYLNAEVATEVRNTEEAMAAGAMALFGEKYGERVRVVTIPDFSVELCGGTHTRATGDIGFFTITEESGVAAGVRRIEAQTGAGAVREHQARRAALRQLLGALNANEGQAPDAVAKLQQETRRLAREVQELKVKAALGGGSSSEGGDVEDVAGIKAIFRSVAGLDKGALRELADSLKAKIKSGVVVLASPNDEGRVAIVASVTPDLKGRVHAGNIVKALAPIVGGGGGGRPDFAEAGGRDPSRVDEMLREGRAVVGQMLQQ